MNRARRPNRRAAPLLLALGLAAAACGGEDGSSPPPQFACLSDLDCASLTTPCVRGRCMMGGQCQAEAKPAGTFVGVGVQGDCRKDVCDGQGAVTSAVDDTDLPVDGNACTSDRCSGGVPSHSFVPDRTACAQDGGRVCSSGACIQCLAPSDCPGSDTQCSARTCTDGICGVTLMPLGTALGDASQTPGDCKQVVCDGVGGITTQPLASDVPLDDGTSCTIEKCVGDVPTRAPVTDGTACSGPGGAVVCNAGKCAQCLAAADCAGTDDECQHRTCTDGACGMAYTAQGTPVSQQTPGDCKQDVCNGTGSVVSVPLASDLPPDDGNACTDNVCRDGVASTPSSRAGTPCAQGGGKVCDGNGACVECNVGTDCASLVCADHACQAPTCTDSTKNGAETDVDCGGGTCPTCANGKACLAAADCASGACNASHVCAAPSCYDGVKNGSETDVDCGGSGSCLRCAVGRACLAASDCASANCTDSACAPPVITRTIPADGVAGVTPATLVTLAFGVPAASSWITAQPVDGTCSGTVQLSADGFATCVGMSVAVPTSTSGSTSVAVLRPAVPLARATTYQLRTTADLRAYSDGAFTPAAVTFATTGGGACGGSLVVSQIYPGGGLPGAAYAKDFVEVHNNGAAPVSLDGLSVQYTSASGYTWTVTPLSGTLAAGGYLLVQEGGGTSGGPALPAPDVTGTIDLSPLGGKVALVATTQPLWSGCIPRATLDFVGYGSSSYGPASCYEGTAPAAAPADYGAALARVGAGCGDDNGNLLDFASQLAVPRNAASPPFVCGCNGAVVNGTGYTVEMDRCSVWSPASMTAVAGQTAGPVYGRVYEFGITDQPGAPALQGELGYGPSASDPRWAAGWTFVPATWNAQVANDDEFQASFTAPAAGSYAYAYRFSADGMRWTYCDPNGAGSAAGSPFEPNSLPPLDVSP